MWEEQEHDGEGGRAGRVSPVAVAAAVPVPVAVADEGLYRRLKAFACTAPLHDLDARKARLDWADAGVYQMAEIAFQAIDQVTIAMDFDRGADHDQVVNRLLPFVASQAPGRSRTEYERIARWVLENLINVGTIDRGFRAVYGTLGVDGQYRRRTFDFKLLIELVASDGGVYLRASDEAINVLVGALDTDVESAQIAAEVKLDNLIRRGRLSDAQVAAEQARYRTVQYAETLRRKLEATRRDVRSVDWESEVPDLVEEALAHIEGRYRVESAILANITTTRDDSEDADHKRRAAALVDIVRDCIRRHTQLQTRLQAAGSVFRAEQDRQQFSGPPGRATVDLFGQLLLPTLKLPLADAARPTGVFFRFGTGVTPTGQVRMLDLVRLLLTPSARRDDLGADLPEPDLVPAAEPGIFDIQQWEHADALFDLGEVPRRLSALLADARALDPGLPGLVVLRALAQVSPEVGTALRQGDQSVTIAVDDGTVLSDPEFAGADLLVASARLERPPGGQGVPAEVRPERNGYGN